MEMEVRHEFPEIELTWFMLCCPVCVFQGGMQHLDRDRVIGEFRRGETKILISTDVLARGFDVSQVRAALPGSHQSIKQSINQPINPLLTRISSRLIAIAITPRCTKSTTRPTKRQPWLLYTVHMCCAATWCCMATVWCLRLCVCCTTTAQPWQVGLIAWLAAGVVQHWPELGAAVHVIVAMC